MTQEEVMAANYAMLRKRDLEIERAAAEAIAREKAKLRDKALPTLLNTVSSDFIHIDESDILEDGKRRSISTKVKMRNELLSVGSKKEMLCRPLCEIVRRKRGKGKIDADLDQKWMIFRDLDAFDEADMVKVARFMETVLKVHKNSLRSEIEALRKLLGSSSPRTNRALVTRAASKTHQPSRLPLSSPSEDDNGATLTEQAQKRLRNNSMDGRDTDTNPCGNREVPLYPHQTPQVERVSTDIYVHWQY